jgi:hypothetical protein
MINASRRQDTNTSSPRVTRFPAAAGSLSGHFCSQCRARFWPVNASQKRCRACRFAYTPPSARAAEAAPVAVVTAAPRVSDREIKARIAKQDAERAGRPARLAAIRAARTAQQRRALGLDAAP